MSGRGRRVALLLLALAVAQALMPGPGVPRLVGVLLRGQTSSSSPAANDEAEAFQNALQSASGNPQLVIQNLQAFLTRFPRSPRRTQVLRIILRQGLESNNPEKAMESAEELLELDPANTDLLAIFAQLTDRPSDPATRQQALRCATRLVQHAENAAEQAKLAPEARLLFRSSSYLVRGKIYEKSEDDQNALADFEKSYAAYPTVAAAERLGDLEAKHGDLSRAIDHYAAAFALPDSQANPEHRSDLRKKLGKVYRAKFRSEKGLGDFILAHYDGLSRTLRPPLQARSAPNTRSLDPYEYVLSRLDGSKLRLKELLGKVVVMDFWATWCGPCRLEGKLLERVRQTFRNEPRAQFLEVNTDENRAVVPGFVKAEAWTVPVVYAEGIDRLLGVRALPTLLIFDPKGRVVFRAEGLDPATFQQTLEQKLREILSGSK